MLDTFLSLLQPVTLLIILLSTTLGIILGAIPGLSGGLGVALCCLMLPWPHWSLALIGAMVAAAVFGAAWAARRIGAIRNRRASHTDTIRPARIAPSKTRKARIFYPATSRHKLTEPSSCVYDHKAGSAFGI